MRALALLLVLAPIVSGLGGPKLLGGYENGDVNSPEVKEIADFALSTLNSKENSARNLSEIVSVKTQVVAGINYDIVLRVQNGDSEEFCEVKVYDISWEHKRELTSYSCKNPNLGGEKSVKLDKDAQAAVMFATDSYNQKANSLYRFVPAKVENVKKQTVAGTLYTFDISFMPTNCMNDPSTFGQGLEACPVDNSGNEVKCTYKVLFQAWVDPKYKLVSDDCGKQLEKPQQPQPPKQPEESMASVASKVNMALKLKNMLKSHNKPTLDELMLQGVPGLRTGLKGPLKDKVNDLLLTPQNMLPELTKGVGNKVGELSNQINRIPIHKRDITSIEDLHPLLADIGKNVLSAYQQGKKDYLNEDGKVDLDKVLGKDGHDLVNHGMEKLLGADGHDLLQHGLDQLLGGDGHDMQEHGFQNLLGGDDHDMIKHGLGKLLGGDGHDYRNHGSLIGGDDHDYQAHDKLIGGDDHDYQKHDKLIGGGNHDYKSHGKLIGGDDHDYKSHDPLIGGDDHDYKPHDPLTDCENHNLCHMGHFKEFMVKHGKYYGSTDEENKRFRVFCDNMVVACKLNKTEQGTAVYGATKFADLTQEEFRQLYLSKKNWADIPNKGAEKMWRAKIPPGTPPTSFDWRDHGAVTPVKNQGQCGSCWAFSTTGNIEGQWKIKRGDLVSLSEQELVDCDKLDEGCNGGLPSNAYMSIMKLGGLETETDYKYEGEDEKCMFNKSEVEVKINGAVNISSDEGEMASWLAQNGPISIGINAMAMQFYFGGISHPWKIFCNPANLDHGVLIVGYGVEDSEPYWIVKNSWGPDWGEKGYYRVYRGGGVCGLNTMCTSAVVN